MQMDMIYTGQNGVRYILKKLNVYKQRHYKNKNEMTIEHCERRELLRKLLFTLERPKNYARIRERYCYYVT